MLDFNCTELPLLNPELSLTWYYFLTFMQLSNHLFEELAMDVYDEVDRRETDAGKCFFFLDPENTPVL